jgi:hypothetical protein
VPLVPDLNWNRHSFSEASAFVRPPHYAEIGMQPDACQRYTSAEDRQARCPAHSAPAGGTAVSRASGCAIDWRPLSTPVIVAPAQADPDAHSDHILERADPCHFHTIDLRKMQFIIAVIDKKHSLQLLCIICIPPEFRVCAEASPDERLRCLGI